jgi:histidine triad (HIT) family protein
MKTFADIVSGQTPSHRVFEDEHHLAFLSRTPIAPGHTIVIPKRVIPYLFDMEPAAYHELWERARMVARSLKTVLGCERVCVAVIGWEVRHAHVHLVPTERAGEFPGLPGKDATDAELDAMLQRLTSAR